MFPEGIQGHMQNSGESELNQQKPESEKSSISYPESSGSLSSSWSPGETQEVSPGNQPLAKEPEDSEHEIEKPFELVML